MILIIIVSNDDINIEIIWKKKTPTISGIPLTLSGRPSSRSSQRSDGDPLNCSTFRRPSSGGSRGPLVPTSRAGAARAAAILLISCHLQATKDGTKHRRTLSDVAEGSTDGLGRPNKKLFFTKNNNNNN